VTMYRHSGKEIHSWVVNNSFKIMRSLPFTMFLDREQTKRVEAKAYVVQRV